MPWRVERTLWPAMLALVLVFAGFEFTNLDLAIQDRLYDFEGRTWLVGPQDVVEGVLFYNGAKAAITVAGVVALAALVLPRRWRERLRIDRRRRAACAVFVLTVVATPVLVGGIKSVTNVFCPFEIRRYGGSAPYVKVLSSYPPGDRPERCGRCFPAGHASGGFALVALAAFARTRRGQLLGFAAGAFVGGTMGFYQMARGAHYLSHTVVTAFIAWILFCLWTWALRRFARPRPAEAAVVVPTVSREWPA